MLKRYAVPVVVSLLLIPLLAFANVKRDVVFRPRPLIPLLAGTMSANRQVGGYTLDNTFTFTKITGYVITPSGGGAGNTVFTVSDGTNTCTFTFACTTTQSAGTYSAAAVNGAGTGCSFASGAVLTTQVTTAGCTTTQPNFQNLVLVGRGP